NWYSPWLPVVTVRSIRDSALARTTFAPVTALSSGSVTVPRSEVVACVQAMLVASSITTSILVLRFHEGGRYATATDPELIMCASKFLFRALGSPKLEGTLLELRKVRTTAGRCQDRSSDRQDVPQVRAHRCALTWGIQRFQNAVNDHIGL